MTIVINHILLYILGMMSISAAIVIGLKSVGWFPTPPEQVLLGFLLLAIGWGILGGVRQARSQASLPDIAGRIGLFTLGIGVVGGAIALVMTGFGWVPQLAPSSRWALLLLAIGGGILGGIRSAR